MLKGPRGRAAIMKGGHYWRLAIPVVSFDLVACGPTGWSTNPEEMLVVRFPETGEEYIDDELTEHECEVLLGLNLCLTGNGDQLAQSSWYPLYKTFQHSGVDYGHWTGCSEAFFSIAASIQPVSKDTVAGECKLTRQPIPITKWRDNTRGSAKSLVNAVG
ncbi:hypothetical protein NLJ89_g2651 [Agrocybe chaxingu]|uniref:Uncharacterized protein n=1 Tax=Agrocybe chaxingu TaxID=84603 RepID=A0A9W8K662_9AGAR|nr:hypothetical protein NLJ89_g2651 [Agrocybe chaxingu]